MRSTDEESYARGLADSMLYKGTPGQKLRGKNFVDTLIPRCLNDLEVGMRFAAPGVRGLRKLAGWHGRHRDGGGLCCEKGGLMAAERIRESVIAGSWYPDHPKSLREQIGKYLDRARMSETASELLGLAVPHAGYMYSGGVAAYAYKLLIQRPFQRVLILAPSHRAHFPGASIYHLGGYRTPLGIVPLDHELVADLRKHSSLVTYVPHADDQEHSLEIQLPFLQVVLGEFQLTPIVMGDQSLESCRQLAQLIENVCRGRKVLLVASTDLSHYHAYNRAKELDQVVLDRVAALDSEGLLMDLRERRCEACGGGPLATIMTASRSLGADEGRVLQYANSGDVTGDRSGVVGYMAAAFCSNPAK